MSADSGYKYRAFVSYSSRDRRWTERFHRDLERYRVPKEIVGKLSRDGEIPRNLFPIFRDRDELPTSANLGEAIESALHDSAYLIVVCSPDAAKSLWVAEEIITFKRLGRTDRILAVIVRGEPNATDRGRVDEEAFPKPLRFNLDSSGELGLHRTEPIAADARSEGDGYEDAKLKVVAGLLGVNFNDLKRREITAARRRMRFAQGIAACMVALAIAAGYFAYQSDLQRRVVERQDANLLQRESELLAQDAIELAAQGKGLEAAQTAIKALPKNFDKPERPLSEHAVSALFRAVRAPNVAHRIRAPVGGTPKALHISPDDRLALVVGSQGVAELWTLDQKIFSQTITQSTWNATAALFDWTRDQRRIMIWGAANPDQVSLYVELKGRMELMFTERIAPLVGAKVVNEGLHASFLLLRDGQLALMPKSALSFADMAARDPRFTLDRYFDGILRRYPKIKTSEIVAALADKDIVALRGPDDRLWIVSTKDESRNQIELPKAGKIAAAGISQDGDNIVVFLEHAETDGLTGKRHLAYLAKVNASAVPITLDVASDFRCRRVSSQPQDSELWMDPLLPLMPTGPAFVSGTRPRAS